MKETVGDRVREIRAARGEKQPKFAQTLTAAAKRLGINETYDNTMVSKMEVGRRDVGLNDAAVIASVDPLERGRTWLAWGEHAEAQTNTPKVGEEVPDPGLRHRRAHGKRA